MFGICPPSLVLFHRDSPVMVACSGLGAGFTSTEGALGESLPGSLPQRLRISLGEMSRDVSAWGKSAGYRTKVHRLGRNNRPFLGLEIQAEDTGRVGLSVR